MTARRTRVRFGLLSAVLLVQVQGCLVEHLVVTSGFGTSLMPIRIGVPPEFVILTMQSG